MQVSKRTLSVKNSAWAGGRASNSRECREKCRRAAVGTRNLLLCIFNQSLYEWLYCIPDGSRSSSAVYELEMCMRMGFSMGIPWESRGNGNKTRNWGWEWEGMGNHLNGNGNYLWEFIPTDSYRKCGQFSVVETMTCHLNICSLWRITVEFLHQHVWQECVFGLYLEDIQLWQ